jgi:DNA-binding transcriptional LysR family regulator
MKNATLKQLKLYLHLAKTGSVTQTAKANFLTQSAVTQQIRLLEEAAHQPLFERLPRGMKLSHAGQSLLPWAERVLDSMQSLMDQSASLQRLHTEKLTGELSLGAVGSCKYFVPRMLADFLEQHPGIIPKLLLGNRDAVFEKLSKREVEVVISGRPPVRGVKMNSEAFAPNQLTLIASPKWLGDSEKKATAKMMALQTWIIRERGSGTRAITEHFWRDHRFHPEQVIETNSNESVKQLVMAGLGVSILPQSATYFERLQGLLHEPHALGLPIYRDWFVLSLANLTPSRNAQAFINFVQQHGSTSVLQ